MRALLGGLRARGQVSAGLALIVLVALFGFVGPLFWHAGSLNVSLGSTFAAPSGAHPFGTDSLGRDVLARTMAATQLDLLVAIIVTVAGSLIGIGIGVVAAAYRGIPDNALMRLMDALLAFPPLVLALGVSIALGAGVFASAVGITLATVPYYARLMRGEMLRVGGLPFVEAARMSGCKRSTLVRRHMLPHTWRIMAVQASSTVGSSVLTLAGLGFIGLGVQSPQAEWGTMISDGLQYVLTGAWWIDTFPGVLLLLLVVGCNLVADGFGEPRRRYWWRPHRAVTIAAA